MQPLGQHIRISKPEVLNKTIFIVEKERVQMAEVIEVSPDIEVPEIKKVIFPTGTEIFVKEQYFLPLDMVLMYD